MPFCTRIHMKCAGVCTVWTTPVQIILSRMIKTLLMMKILLVSSLAKVEKITERDSVVSLWKALIGPPDSWWYKYLQWSARTFKILYLYIFALAIGKALLSLDITHLKNACILSIWLLDCCYYIVTASLWLFAFHWQCLLKPCAFASMLEACRAEMNGELPCQAFFFSNLSTRKFPAQTLLTKNGKSLKRNKHMKKRKWFSLQTLCQRTLQKI